jgi:hypothetical protein
VLARLNLLLLLEAYIPMCCRKRFFGFGRVQDRCFAAAVGRVRKNRTLTPHPLVGSRLRSCDRKCDVPLPQGVAASLVANAMFWLHLRLTGFEIANYR